MNQSHAHRCWGGGNGGLLRRRRRRRLRQASVQLLYDWAVRPGPSGGGSSISVDMGSGLVEDGMRKAALIFFPSLMAV